MKPDLHDHSLCECPGAAARTESTSKNNINHEVTPT